MISVVFMNWIVLVDVGGWSDGGLLSFGDRWGLMIGCSMVDLFYRLFKYSI